jgi:hypothetical protein
MRAKLLFFSVLFTFNFSFAQDTTYARSVIKFLTSKKCFGRGYLNNGLDVAAKYIANELKSNKALPFLSTGYFQWFEFNVNTFPDKVIVKLNNKLLKPGIDYLISPESTTLKGKYSLQKKDSATYIANNCLIPLTVKVKQKLTYGVATNSTAACVIEVLNAKTNGALNNVEVNIESKVLTKYINKNICGYIPGKINNDTVMVFSAHYDHLGGMGKATFFPGANDNACGVSVLLNLVKYYSKNPPKYKTLFIFFAGEEAGLLGSKYFVESKVTDLKKIKFLVNFDLLGTGDDGIMVVNGYTFEKQFSLLESINKEKNLVKEIKRRGKASNSDHYWFSEAGVPCFFIYTLGGIKAYHDVYDVAKTLPLTEYVDVFKLVTEFTNKL